jgi:hypothetical protein
MYPSDNTVEAVIVILGTDAMDRPVTLQDIQAHIHPVAKLELLASIIGPLQPTMKALKIHLTNLGHDNTAQANKLKELNDLHEAIVTKLIYPHLKASIIELIDDKTDSTDLEAKIEHAVEEQIESRGLDDITSTVNDAIDEAKDGILDDVIYRLKRSMQITFS